MVDFGPDGTWGGSGQSDVYWWLTKKKADTLSALTADFQHLANMNQRLESYETFGALYSNRRIDAGSPLMSNFEASWAIGQGKYSRCAYNLMKQVVDEVHSRIVKSQPRARFMTHGANRKLQRRAEHMQRWNDMQVHKLHESAKFDASVKDALLYGLGALKFFKAYREDRVQAERCFPGNLFVDLQETIFDKPTRLHHRRYVSKRALQVWFPKFKDKIERAGTVSDHARYVSYFGQHMSNIDTCEIIESWHLPSYLNKDGTSPDGVRVLWCDQTILQISPYNRRTFPFAFFNWKQDPNNTFYGIGLGEDLLGVHVDANVTLKRVNTAIEFLPNPYVLVRQGSKIQASDITNAPGTIIEYAGSDPPQVVMPPTVPGDLLSYVREHEARAYKIAGLSSAQATGDRMPAGLETGRAVENYFQIESVPFATQLRKFEFFVQDVAENNVAVGREIYEKNKSFKVVIEDDKNTITELSWSEVSIDPREDSYVIRAAPTSSLSESFSARLGEAERLVQMFPNMSEAAKRDLINSPDLEHESDVATATLHNIDNMIEKALDDNEYVSPTPFMDLDLFVIRANMEEQRGADTGVPEQNLATLRRMIVRANEMRQKQIMAAVVAQRGMMTPTAVPQDPQQGTAPTAVQG